MLKLRFAFLATALACASAVQGQAPATAPAPALPDADPAIWVVKDPDTTIYLFGTFHALDGKSAWFNDEVKAAFDRSKELVLEIPPVDDPASIQPIIMKYALDTSGKPLSDRLSPATKEKFVAALAKLGAPPNAFDKFTPFFAALTLTMANAQKLGMTAANGSEAVLTKAAKDDKKPISGLETIEYQMSIFANLSDAEQIAMLEQTLDELDEVAGLFKKMNDHWSKGDSEGMAALINEMNAKSPKLYKVLLTDRNANWAEWIDKRLDQPGVVFVGVGAGHLGGETSVQALLAKRGIKSERLTQ
ncbi:TraB/GumN family protein [Sphingomonas daechungensis]|uniref:TraB/GumN family protein n=1 Tax=Sphingomonas daechungensis TaxID=1176646 RepID=A0ABX6T347_9SPHN|nr:TraB/GumN family protein [Sphingomonas daechungensis]QNP43317.1 TraB/GumN family protein [Sphingomonas daechungensis]